MMDLTYQNMLLSIEHYISFIFRRSAAKLPIKTFLLVRDFFMIFFPKARISKFSPIPCRNGNYLSHGPRY